jgi:hypothetical protein
MHVGGGRGYMGTLYLSLNFAVNLQLLFKNCLFKKESEIIFYMLYTWQKLNNLVLNTFISLWSAREISFLFAPLFPQGNSFHVLKTRTTDCQLISFYNL